MENLIFFQKSASLQLKMSSRHAVNLYFAYDFAIILEEKNGGYYERKF